MMDIKHLCRRGLLRFDGESFPGVIAITYNRHHYAAALAQSSGRPEILLYGDIDDLITSETSEDAKRLRQRFPMQAINLDYTNSLFGQANVQPISDHLAAVEEIIRLQHRHNAQEFVLLLTTRAERSKRPGCDQFTRDFLNDLAQRVDENIMHHTDFRSSFEKTFGRVSGDGLLRRDYAVFVPIGLSKLICQMLAQHSFELAEIDGRVLERNKKPPIRWLLHLALRVRPAIAPRARRLSTLGRSGGLFERHLAGFIEQVGAGELAWINEKDDHDRLNARYGSYVGKLASQTLDLKIPEAERRST
jgi:hypothetical protein